MIDKKYLNPFHFCYNGDISEVVSEPLFQVITFLAIAIFIVIIASGFALLQLTPFFARLLLVLVILAYSGNLIQYFLDRNSDT